MQVSFRLTRLLGPQMNALALCQSSVYVCVCVCVREREREREGERGRGEVIRSGLVGDFFKESFSKLSQTLAYITITQKAF